MTTTDTTVIYPNPTRMDLGELVAYAASLLYPPGDPRHPYPDTDLGSWRYAVHLGQVRSALRSIADDPGNRAS